MIMPWWQKTLSSSPKSSSSSSTASSSITNPKPKTALIAASPSRCNKNLRREFSYLFRNHQQNRPNQHSTNNNIKPRLTRQRKLRHLTDLDVGRLPIHSYFNQENNENGSLTRTVSSAPSMSSIVLEPPAAPAPQPLPLPEQVIPQRDSAVSSACQSPRFCLPFPSPLPSPRPPTPTRDIPSSSSRADDSDVDADSEDAATRRYAYQNYHKKSEQVDTQATNSPIYRVRRMHQDPIIVDNTRSNFRLHDFVMSAPGSGFSSPALSPRRISTGDFWHSPCVSPKELGVWSAPDIPSMDVPSGFSRQASPDVTLASLETSSRVLNPKIASGAGSHLPNKLSNDNSSAWHENNGPATVHPLPLPPRAAVSSQTDLAHQTTAKPEVSPMKTQWQKGKLIGRGTFGSVYVATNRETGALCAMKEVDMIPDDPKSAECIKQLEQEIKVLSQLKHPNIVQYYGSEIVDYRFYIYLEYVHPGSINKYVQDHCGAMTENVARSFTRHILHGLAYLHSTNTIHRDIKGANLLVDAYGVVKLADFGMAKHLSGQAAELSLRGSPYWMAPEVIHPGSQKDSSGDFAFAVDIWSLGCTIIEMLNGKPPWSEYEGVAAMFKAWKETPPIPDTLSPAGKDFLLCCFRRNPADRPSAFKLLDHPFLRSSQQMDAATSHQKKKMDVPASNQKKKMDARARTQAFSGLKLDTSYIPREWIKYTVDSIPPSPISPTPRGRLSTNGTNLQCDQILAQYQTAKPIPPNLFLLDAWARACSSSNSTIILVPPGRFLINHVVFSGQCSSTDITFHIDGTLVAPWDYHTIVGDPGRWISFAWVMGVSLQGGILDGSGSTLLSCKAAGKKNCSSRATSLSFTNSKNIVVKGLKSTNSQMFHIAVNGCQNVKMDGLQIMAPANSPNTDGIHVQLSTNVTMNNSMIKAGDDCISIGPGTTTNLWIQHIACGPGHGISIGSLGKDLDEQGVGNVTVTSTVFSSTQNGLEM